MTKRLFFLLGVLVGVLFATVAYRKRMERLKTLETQATEADSLHDEYTRDRQAALAAMPFKERMEYELFQASLNLDNGVPSWKATTMKYRISQRLNNHLNELRKRAIKEKNEKLRADYWWLYFNAKGIETEIREMMLKTENVTLMEMMTNYGLTEIILEDQKDIAPEDDEEEPQPPVDDVDDEDIPPQQKKLWDD